MTTYYHVTKSPWTGGDLLSWLDWHREDTPPCNLDYDRDDYQSIYDAHCPDHTIEGQMVVGSHDLPCWYWDHCPGTYSDDTEVAMYASLDEALRHKHDFGCADIVRIDWPDQYAGQIGRNGEGYPYADRVPREYISRVIACEPAGRRLGKEERTDGNKDNGQA